MEIKYKLGQKIKYVNDPDIDAGEIVHISINSDRVIYTISLQDWSPETRTPVSAVKHILQDEAILMEDKANE